MTALETGYAFKWGMPQDEKGPTWRTSDDEAWEIVVLDSGDVQGARYAGQRRVDGTLCSVFVTKRGVFAQVVLP